MLCSPYSVHSPRGSHPFLPRAHTPDLASAVHRAMASSARVGASVDGGGGGGKEPEPKRRRLLDAGGPIENDETARQKMRDAWVYDNDGEIVGFDPDNVADIKSFSRAYPCMNAIKPMGYFASEEDLPMMRWLYVNGADTRDEDAYCWFPMHVAANNGRTEACKWLFDHGAAGDIKKRTRESKFYSFHDGCRPLTVTFGTATAPSYRTLSRWLILRGALCKDDNSGKLDVERMRKDLDYRYVNERELLLEWAKERGLLLEWANELHRARTSFLLFLLGALSCPKHAYRTRRSSSPARILSGQSGVLELIGDYTGIVRGREAKIIRRLTELLPALNKELDSE